MTGHRDQTEILAARGAGSPLHREQFAAERTQVRSAKMRRFHRLEIRSDSIRSQSSRGHDDFGSNRSISLSVFRKLDIHVMKVIDILMSVRDGGGKPVSSFPHPALDRREGRATAGPRHFDHAGL